MDPSSGACVRKAAELPTWTTYIASGEDRDQVWAASGSLYSGSRSPLASGATSRASHRCRFSRWRRTVAFLRHRWIEGRREMAEDKVESFASGHFIRPGRLTRREPVMTWGAS